jgi:hypothetical protein
MRSSRHETHRRDRHGVVHILDDSLADGFAWCNKAPTDLIAMEPGVATCLLCIVIAAKYRGLVVA